MEVGESSSQSSFSKLLWKELRLDPGQWEERSSYSTAASPACPQLHKDEKYFELDALVHEDWLQSLDDGGTGGAAVGGVAGRGGVFKARLPLISQEEVHWLLQASCESVLPEAWQRVHVVCIRKPPWEQQASRRTLVPQASSFSCESVHEFLTQVAHESLLLSWKEVMGVLRSSPPQHPIRAPLTSMFVHELVEQLYHKKVHLVHTHPPDDDEDNRQHQNRTRNIRRPQSGPKMSTLSSSQEFGSELLGTGEQSPHPNLSSLLAVLESCHAYYFVYPYLRFTLFDVVMHSPAMLEDSVAKPLFVLYQLLSLLQHCHLKGVTLGQVGLRNVFMDARLWIQMRLPVETLTSSLPSSLPPPLSTHDSVVEEVRTMDDGLRRTSSKVIGSDAGGQEEDHCLSGSAGMDKISDGGVDRTSNHSSTPQGSLHPSLAGSTHTLLGLTETSTSSASYAPPYHYPPLASGLCETTLKWRNGELSNFDYLLVLNHHAGRVPGDPNNHPIFPWVMEFTHKDGGYRDLTKSKYRLNKGDQQLDFTYISAQEELRQRSSHQDGLVPYHIGDISSEVTYYVYLARKTPKAILCSCVRPQWVPEEYPSTLEKMYIWTPDECIPEYFTDPSIFRSIHPDLPDLILPSWASSPEEVISVHRAVLEGDIVSSNLHYWIDIMFGYKLSGHDAVRYKNVYVSLVDKHRDPKNCGIVQLFKSSHPKRIQSSSAPLAVFEWNSYLSMSSVSSATLFNVLQPLPEEIGISSTSTTTSALHTRGARSAPKKGEFLERSDQKTLESIISQKTSTLEDASSSDAVQENQEDDFTGSFEHVNMDDIKDKLLVPTSTPNASNSSGSSSGPGGEIGINYGDSSASTPSDGGKTPNSQGKSRSESVVVIPATSSRFRNPVNIFLNRQRNKVNNGEVESGHDKQQSATLPKEANFLQRLTKLEEMAHFAFKSCKDDGTLYQNMWDPDNLPVFDISSELGSHPLVRVLDRLEECPHYYPSFEERVALDVAMVVCTLLELCCMKQLRAATPTSPSSVQRIALRQETSGHWTVVYTEVFLAYLVDFSLCPETQGNLSPISREPKLPSLTPAILLQPFLPIVAFPSYFSKLYSFTSQLERLCRARGFDYATLDLPRLASQGLSLQTDTNEKNLEPVLIFVSEQLEGLLAVVSEEGFPLLLLHLFPFFQYPQTSFDAIYTLFPQLSVHMSRRNVERIFTSVVIRLFDTATEPHHRGQLYSRTTADVILKRFGLNIFLNRFLGFLIEAVVEPMRLASSKVSSSKRHNANIVRMKSQSVLTLMASDLLPSPVYNGIDGCERSANLSSNLSYSLVMSEHSYGNSDKEFSSSEESDNDMAECSLLAKSSVLSSGGDGELGEVGGDVDVSHSPLVMALERASNNGGSCGSVTAGLDKKEDLGGSKEQARESMVFVSREEADGVIHVLPGSSLLGSLSMPNIHKEQQLLSSFQDSVSITSSLRFDPSQSLASFSSEDSFVTDVRFTSSLPPGHLGQGGRYGEKNLMKLGQPLRPSNYDKHYLCGGNSGRGKLGNKDKAGRTDEGKEGEVDEEGDTDTLEEENATSYDPELLAVNLHVSEVAGDCLCWLLRRLGPLLSSKHIVRPLVESMHRCFTGVLGLRGKEVMALKCLSSFAECYGETVVREMYVPHAENMVGSAINRMTVKSEANVAASLGLVKVSIKMLSKNSLQSLALEICDRYFLPLIQLLSSQTSFPSGGKARAAICQSMVKLLALLGDSLGREEACRLLGPTLQCFFASFSSVHEIYGSSSATTVTPSTSVGVIDEGMEADAEVWTTHTELTSSLRNTHLPSRTRKKSVEFHTLMADKDMTRKQGEEEERSSTGTGPHTNNGDSIPDSEYYRQLCATFSKAMAFSAYITFCRLLGQYYLQDCLCNAELVEQLAYSHDEVAQPNIPLADIFTDPIGLDTETTSDSSDSEEDYDYDDEEVDVTMARDAALKVGPIVAVTGLNMEESGFRKSSWFVDLEERETEENIESALTLNKPVGRENTLQRNVATFDARFSNLAHIPESPGVQTGRGQGPTAMPISGPVVNDQDFTLVGAWEELWESQLHESVYQREGFHHFRGGKLQSYTGANGHKAAVKALAVSNGEHFFLSGSRDKTVKVWSLRNQGLGSVSVPPQLTYSGHQKSVVAVELLEETDTVASCDGALHLWDPETGYLVHQFTSPRNSNFVTIKPLPSSQSILVAATSDAHLRFVDTRMKSLLHLWKLQFPTGGIIRSVACAENWVSVGNHNGSVNTLDVRTGELLSLWKPADYSTDQNTWNENLIQIKATRRGNLVTSVGSGLLSLWRPTHGRFLYHLLGQSHSTNCLEVVGDQLLSAASNGNIVIHTGFESSRDCHTHSQRCSKKPVTALAALQENKLLLLGHDNGQILLMA